MEWRTFLCLLGLGACGVTPAGGRYVGPAPACADAGGGSTATLVRTGDDVAFAPTDGALVIHGILGPGGTFAGSLSTRAASTPDTIGGGAAAPKGRVRIFSIAGMLGPEQTTMTYATPGCQAKVVLTRVHPGLL